MSIRITDSHNKATVKLDIRKLSAILNLHFLSFENTAICTFCSFHFRSLSPYFKIDTFRSFFKIDIVDNEALVLNVVLFPHDAGTVTFYVPVVLMNLWETEVLES
jgi:hypothetical protein